jgi:hypothetical protein
MPGELQDALEEKELLERERPGSAQQGGLEGGRQHNAEKRLH